MTQTIQTLDNQFTTLTDEELTHIEGGVAPFIVYGGCILGRTCSRLHFRIRLMKRHLHTIIFAFIIGLTMLHDAHLIAFQPNINLAIAATIYLAVDATLNQVKNKKEN